jgi:hypothetical protein
VARIENVHGVDVFLAATTEQDLKSAIAYSCWKEDSDGVCEGYRTMPPQEVIDKFFSHYDMIYLWEYIVPLLP